MKYLSTLLLITCFFLGQLGISKKDDYLSGYVVLSQGDTLKGYVKPLKYSYQKEIYFKDSQQKEQKYSADMLRAFMCGAEKYVAVNKSELGYDKYIAQEVIFLQEVIEGPVSLYLYAFCYQADSYGRKWSDRKSYKKECKEYYYFKKKEGAYFAAYQKNKYALAVLKDKQAADNFQLAGYFDECEDLSKKILYKAYKQSQVELMATDYNTWYSKEKRWFL